MKYQKCYFGKDAIADLQKELHILAPKKVFLFRGKRSYETCGAKIYLDEIFNNEHIQVEEWSDFEENPKIEDVLKGFELLKQSGASAVIACGGGSVLDMAKLVRFIYSYEGELISNVFMKRCEILPLFAIPTTAGTGAEATCFSVLYKDKIKYSVEHKDILPNYAIVYPPFTYNNTKYLTACTGFDALAQSIEAYWNLNSSRESDLYAEKAINLLWCNLPTVVNHPTHKIRDLISEGSYWAGRAINITKTTAPHAFSYPFTSNYGYPHGHAVALTFPYFMELNCSEHNPNQLRILRLCSLLKLDINSNLKAQMQAYVKSIGLQKRVGDEFDMNFIIGHVNLDRLLNNPIKILKNNIVSVDIA